MFPVVGEGSKIRVDVCNKNTIHSNFDEYSDFERADDVFIKRSHGLNMWPKFLLSSIKMSKDSATW